MGDFWSGTTPYDENQGDRDRRDAERQRVEREAIDARMQNYIQNPSGSFDVHGSNDVAAMTQANLSQVGAMTGQNIFDAGQQQQDYYQSLQARRNGTDAVGADMKNAGNRNMALMSRQIAGKGISGGAGADMMLQAQRSADANNAKQQQGFGRQNDQDLWNYVKKNQKVTGEALAGGKDAGLASGMDTSAAEGTLACLLLVSLGFMSKDLYAKESEILKDIDPIVLTVYKKEVGPILVRNMKKSPYFTKAVTPFAVSWAEERTGVRPNFLGKVVKHVGEPFLKLLGKLREV